jgi:hypothetical protein
MMTLLTMRLKDMRRTHPGQVSGMCQRCGEEVGIYPSGQDAIKKWVDVEIVCTVCRPIDGREPLAPGAMREAWEAKER